VNVFRQSYIVCEHTRIPCYLVKCLCKVFDVEHNYHQFVRRPYVKRFVICYRTVVCLSVCPVCLSCSVCDVGVWWPKVGWIQVKLGMQVGLGPGHILLDGTQVSSTKGHSSPQFAAHICFGQIARWIKIPLGSKVGLDPSDIVLHGNPAPPPQKRAEPFPQFSAHIYYGQTAASFRMKLGIEVGLVHGHIVLEMNPAVPPPKGYSPQF